jgi:hypothetical protein
MSRTLHAVIIGINVYNEKIPGFYPNLNGAVPDATAFNQYLEGYCKRQGWTYNPQVLLDKKATRNAIIEGYQNLQKAKAGDTCLVYYSGHGIPIPAPKEFWIETNQQNQALACADSLVSGRVLIDKEIAYLGSKITENKDVHFVEIYDCCHSQGMTRSLESNIRVRSLARDADSRGWRKEVIATEYLGYEEYKKEIDPITRNVRRVSTPMPKRVLLSACLSTEEAKEDVVNNVNRGFFTYSIIEALETYGENLTYKELMEYAYFNTKKLVAPVKEAKGDQTPQYDLNDVEPNTVFLTGEVKSLAREYIVGYDVEMKKWSIKAGEINGFVKNTPIKLRLTENDKEIKVSSVSRAYSILDDTDTASLDKNRFYKARIIQMAQTQVEIDLPDTPLSAEIEKAFKKQFETDVESLDFRFVQNIKAPYQIQANTNKTMSLVRTKDNRLMSSPYAAKDFGHLFKDASTIGRWHQLLNLKNPITRFTKEDVTISITVENPQSSVKTITNPAVSEPLVLNTISGVNPSIIVEIKNTYKLQKKLWVSVLYMSDNFEIINTLLPNRKEEVLPNNTVTLSYDGDPRIELAVNEDLLKMGVKNALEYLKIIVSTDTFDTNDWTQDAISQAGTRGPVKKATSGEDPMADWATFEVALQLQHIS